MSGVTALPADRFTPRTVNLFGVRTVPGSDTHTDPAGPVTDRPHRTGPHRTCRGLDSGLRATAAAGLLVSGAVHLHLAPGYSLVGTQITEGALFRAQAVAAVVATLALVARRSRLGWLPAVAVAAGSLCALVATVYLTLPAIGPLPPLHEPVWFTEKAVAAVAAGLALLAAGVGACLPLPAQPTTVAAGSISS